MDEVVKIIQTYTALPEDVIKDESRLVEDLGADSLTLTEIFTTIESKYEIEEVPLTDLVEVKTVKDVRDMINKYTLAI